MSTLRSALDEFRIADLDSVEVDSLVADLDELEHAARVVDFERSRRLSVLEHRRAFAVDGHLSMVSWIADRQRVSTSTASTQVRTARALDAMPATAEALSTGEISGSAADVLASARESSPHAFDRSEEALVDAARNLGVGELRRVIDRWRERTDPRSAAEEEERRFERRRLDVAPALDGMVRTDGNLDPETGQTLITALRAWLDAEARRGPDARTPAQRRADALGGICRWWLDSADRPRVAGERPHVVVTVDVDALAGRLGRRTELEDVGHVTSETARRWACDADVTRVVTDARSMPLDVGRRTKVVPMPLRRAVAVRDRGCRFPGCDRPQGWCDAHHVIHWADGGSTALDNLVLLCRPHHRVVHNRGFRVEMDRGEPVFTRPDGTILEGRAPP